MPPYSSNENKIEPLEIMPNNTKELDLIGPLEIRQLEENRVTTKIVENKIGNGEIIRENGLSSVLLTFKNQWFFYFSAIWQHC
jgi:hypothetical protein